MKKMQIALAALIFSTTFVVAQPTARIDKHPHGLPKAKAYDKLNLSDDQKAKQKAATEAFRKQMQTINSNNNQTVQQQKDAREALIKQHKTQLENILTADQKAQLEQMKAEGKEKHGEKATAHLDKMKQELNLTDQQVSQLRSNQELMKRKMEAIQNNTSLNSTVRMEQMKTLRDEQRKNMEQILTPEQQQKWQGMMKNRPHHPRTKRGDYQKSAPQS